MLDIWFGHLPPGLNKGYLTLAPCLILIIWFGQLPSGLRKRISHLGAMLDIWFGQLPPGLNERYLTLAPCWIFGLVSSRLVSMKGISLASQMDFICSGKKNIVN